jgi:5-(carboxyamino)imidazole ribonucleotide synthase
VSREKTLGVLGGGQLGRMFVQAAQAMGFETVVLCADSDEPAAQISNHHFAADYNDRAALQKLAEACCAVTTEFENVSFEALAFLAEPALSVRVSPKASVVRIAQDRVLEKAHFASCGVPTAPYHVMESDAHIAAVPSDFYPAILKTARMGYDGKGQVTVYSQDELQAAWNGLSQVVCVLEKRLPLAAECSVLLARDATGNIIHWPLQRNVHVDGILATTAVASNDPLEAALVLASKQIATELDYVGVLCIEFFILADGSWVVNEMAPRPHNSGHVTMNASSMSQFEAQVRVAADLPLVPPRQHSSVVMINLLGGVWRSGEPDWAAVLALGSDSVGVHLHLYGKSEARMGRKMGHINITAQNLSMAWQTATSIQHLLQ